MLHKIELSRVDIVADLNERLPVENKQFEAVYAMLLKCWSMLKI